MRARLLVASHRSRTMARVQLAASAQSGRGNSPADSLNSSLAQNQSQRETLALSLMCAASEENLKEGRTMVATRRSTASEAVEIICPAAAA